MSDGTELIQNAHIGSKVNQIATQNNYYGMTSEEASKLAINLFMENFPKLQEKAEEIAKSRADEFCSTLIEKLKEQKVEDFDSFSDPDMQYILYETQKDYARFGTKELLNVLTEIVSNRTIFNKNEYIKINLDKAAKIAPFLCAEHFDYISLLFLGKHIRFNNINSIEGVKNVYEVVTSPLKCPKNEGNMIPFLNMLGCFSLGLGIASEHISEIYNLNKNEVEKIIPNKLKRIPTDYILSPVGVILAIINIQEKTQLKLRMENFIRM